MFEENIQDKIETWLREDGLQYNMVPNPEVNTNIAFWPNPELKMHAIPSFNIYNKFVYDISSDIFTSR
jgi:hypothetical protein